MVESVVAHGNRVWASHNGVVSVLDAGLNTSVDSSVLDMSVNCVTSDGRYIVGISNDQKEVRVYTAEGLQAVATHEFPKRPSAVDVLGDNLVVADKFGDVFHTTLTASSKADRPILGHVSMVLDVNLAAPTVIISSDRDEHVRVSRFPQAFVIDRFLLAHESFVSHLATSGDLLVTAGGDPFVLLWNWRTGTSLGRLDVEGNVIALAIEGKHVYIAVEGASEVVKALVEDLKVVEHLGAGGAVQDLAAVAGRCYAALPSAVVTLGGSDRFDFEGESDAKTEKHLLKRGH